VKPGLAQRRSPGRLDLHERRHGGGAPGPARSSRRGARLSELPRARRQAPCSCPPPAPGVGGSTWCAEEGRPPPLREQRSPRDSCAGALAPLARARRPWSGNGARRQADRAAGGPGSGDLDRRSLTRSMPACSPAWSGWRDLSLEAAAALKPPKQQPWHRQLYALSTTWGAVERQSYGAAVWPPPRALAPRG